MFQNKRMPIELDGPRYEYSTVHQAYIEAKKRKQKFLQYNGISIDIDPARVSKIVVNGKAFDVN